MCFRLSLLQSVSYLFLLYCSLSFQECNILDKIFDIIKITPSLHLFANMFVFGDFNSPNVKWLKPYNVTDVAHIQTFSFSVAHFLSQIVKLPNRFRNNNYQHDSFFDLSLNFSASSCR